MDKDLAQKAISAALKGDWHQAIDINKQIVNDTPDDIDALNRLARAHAELGEIDDARDTARRVLQLDQFNTIATKSLDKWKNLKKGETYSTKISHAQLFLEEPGKTKICALLNLGDNKMLSKLDSGDEVKINHHSHRCSVLTLDGKYIGKLPDDLSARLRKLVGFGNEYGVFIKSANNNEVKVFIRELKRAPKLTDVPSFPGERIDYISFTPPELVHDKGEIIEIVNSPDELD